jgi:single-stranded-DNA-specific exonuclease
MVPNLKKVWKYYPIIPASVIENLNEYPPILRQILFNREITDPQKADSFLRLTTQSDTDPFQIKNMPEAIDRILTAIDHREKIAIYGDYDVDGVTATVLLVEAIGKYNIPIIKYIPNRYDEGYGLNIEALDSLYNTGVRLVITVDCGARSVEEAKYSQGKGLDLIISDHHQMGSESPQAFAILNPKQTGDGYPEKELTGVGLAYKIASALLSKRPLQGISADDWLDLVALGTVADMAPLLGENRELVSRGLGRIQKQERPGLLSLIRVAGIKSDKISASDIGFLLGPRLNASGRIDSAEASFELLNTRDVNRAGELAQILDNLNSDRQTVTRETQSLAAEKAMSENPNAYLIFASDTQFKEGILGLAAARLVETYYRPSIVASQGEEYTRASCRSIPSFHITDALDQCAALIEKYGGHRAAAGFTVKNDNLLALITKLNRIAEEQLSTQDLQPVLEIESVINLGQEKGEGLNQILQDLERLQPTGSGNPEPIFCSYNLGVRSAQAVGKEKNHLRLILEDENKAIYNGIAFRQGYWAEKMSDYVDVAYTLEINEYMGRKNIQLNIKDIQSK